MRLLYLADIRFPLERANGIQTLETCHALARRGVQVTLRVRPDSQDPPRDPYAFYDVPRIDRLAIETAGTPARPATLRRVMYLATSWLRAVTGPWDVVLTRDLGMAAALARVPRGERPPLVYESHGYAPDVLAEMHEMLTGAAEAPSGKLSRLAARERLVWRRADGYVAITRTLAVELVERFGARARLAVIPDGVRASIVSPPREAIGSTPVVAYAGHLYPWKGVDVLIEALSLLPAAHGLIIGGHPGEADLGRCRDLAATLGVSEQITFTGMLPPAAVGTRLASADILVLPNPPLRISKAYTSPLKLFEYMAAGRPIVASDLPAIREILDAESAVLVTPGSARAVADGVERLIRDPGLAARLARHAAARAGEFTWDARARRLEEEFAHVVEDRRP